MQITTFYEPQHSRVNV